MRTFDVKGCVIGAGRPKTIVSVMLRDERDRPDKDHQSVAQRLVAQALAAVAAGSDCIELRADSLPESYDATAVAELVRELGAALPHAPLIFTFRTKGQGGLRELATDKYVELNRAVIACGGADLVDVEATVGDKAARGLVECARSRGVRTIASYHDFAGTPPSEHMVDRLAHMARLGADLPKLAVMAHDRLDALRLMEATVRAHDALGMPMITMAMGGDGVLTRLAGQMTGSAMTFCALGTASAPGQVELGLATRCLDDLDEALGAFSRSPEAARVPAAGVVTTGAPASASLPLDSRSTPLQEANAPGRPTLPFDPQITLAQDAKAPGRSSLPFDPRSKSHA
jgi:3-dehydroquinate dehydratase-1